MFHGSDVTAAYPTHTYRRTGTFPSDNNPSTVLDIVPGRRWGDGADGRWLLA